MIGRSSIRISIVVPVYNQTSLLPVLLNSIDEPDLDGQIEVIIVDDRSNEDVEKAISRCNNRNPVSIVSRESNGGYAAAVNTGISVANGDAVLLLNSDAFLTRSYIALLLNTIEKNKKQQWRQAYVYFHRAETSKTQGSHSQKQVTTCYITI